MKSIRIFLYALIFCSLLFFVSCKSTYVSTSKPDKNGNVIVVGVKQMNMIFFNSAEPRAWLIDTNSGTKTSLEVVFE